MKDINNSDMEKMLLTGKSLDELIQMKIQEDYTSIRNIPPKKIQKIEDISKLSKEIIFSKSSVFKVFNKSTRMESFMNGVQAEALLGLQDNLRDSLVSGKIRAFVSGDSYVEFMYAKTAV